MTHEIRAQLGFLVSANEASFLPEVLEIAGAPEDSAMRRILAAIEDSNIGWRDFGLGVQMVDIRTDPENPFDTAQIFMPFTEELTLGELDEVFGDLLREDPPALGVYSNGEGDGAFDIVVTAIEFTTGQELTPYVLGYGAWRLAQSKLLSLQYREARQGVERWQESGTMPDRLLQVIQAKGWWYIDDLAEGLKIDKFKTAELLRASGFQSENTWGPGYWLRQTPDTDSDIF